MDDARKARPVSGEIMTGAPLEQASNRAAPSTDIVDAEYVVVTPDRRAAERPSRPEPQATSALPPAGMAMLRQAEEPKARQRDSGGPMFWLGGIIIIVAAFWVSGGHALVRHSMQAVAPAERNAFSISGVTSRVDASGPHAVLFVDGEAANDGSVEALLPALSIRVTGNDGRVTVYNLGTSGRPLRSGERFVFSSRLDVPKDGVKSVSVTFAE